MLLSFSSFWVWYKCVKEWEYFSMWGWKEVRRIESLSIFTHGPAWSKASRLRLKPLQATLRSSGPSRPSVTRTVTALPSSALLTHSDKMRPHCTLKTTALLNTVHWFYYLFKRKAAMKLRELGKLKGFAIVYQYSENNLSRAQWPTMEEHRDSSCFKVWKVQILEEISKS